MKKRTNLKAGHVKSKLGHWVKPKKNQVHTLEGIVLIQSA